MYTEVSADKMIVYIVCVSILEWKLKKQIHCMLAKENWWTVRLHKSPGLYQHITEKSFLQIAGTMPDTQEITSDSSLNKLQYKYVNILRGI